MACAISPHGDPWRIESLNSDSQLRKMPSEACTPGSMCLLKLSPTTRHQHSNVSHPLARALAMRQLAAQLQEPVTELYCNPHASLDVQHHRMTSAYLLQSALGRGLWWLQSEMTLV